MGTRSRRLTHWAALLATAAVLAALSAHAVQLPNKLHLDGPLWLAVQQQLYRGWGAVFGPLEIAAVVSAWGLVYLMRGRRPGFAAVLAAALLLSAALASFPVLVAPVNAALAGWTPATLPADWPAYRLRWELGHALAFLFVLAAFIALLRALCLDTRDRPRRSD